MQLVREDPLSGEAHGLLVDHLHYVAARLPDLTRPCVAQDLPGEVKDFTPPSGAFLVGRDRGRAVACGAFRHLDSETAEIKRMWVSPAYRGRGIGRMILASLEHAAATAGYRRVVLDTHERLAEAMALYRSAGYDLVPAYNDNADATHWFARSLKPVAMGADWHPTGW